MRNDNWQESLAGAVAELAAIFVEPNDDTLEGLNRAIAEAPDDETLKLIKADRLDELGKPFLATALRTSTEFHRIQRQMMESVVQSCGVPAHLLSPNGASPCSNDSPTAPAASSS